MLARRGSLLETWLLMEYADRGSLSDALRSGRFPTRDYNAIYRCLLDIASGAALASPLRPFPINHHSLRCLGGLATLTQCTSTDTRRPDCLMLDCLGHARKLSTECEAK